MTDKEHDDWWSSLSDKDQDKLVERTFKGRAEYWVYWADASNDGETQGPNPYDTLADAERDYAGIVADPTTVAARIEKVVGHYRVCDRDLGDRDYTTIKEHGVFPDDAA